MNVTNYAQVSYDPTRIRAARSSAPTIEFMESFKNAEGKYQCVTCDKSYLHFKHLKRHYMKHTGNRPHVCKICQDTFCRSDILKRHFARCLAKFQVTGKCAAVSRVPKRIVPQSYYHPATTTLYQKHQLPAPAVSLGFQQSPGQSDFSSYYLYPSNAPPNSVIPLQDKTVIQQLPLPQMRTATNPTAPALTASSPLTSPIPNNSPPDNYVPKQQQANPDAYYSPPLPTHSSFPLQQQHQNYYRTANPNGFIYYSDSKQQQPQQHYVPPPPSSIPIQHADDSNVGYMNNIYLASPRSISSSSSSSIFSPAEPVKSHYGNFYHQQSTGAYGQSTAASTATTAVEVTYQLPPLAPGIIIAASSSQDQKLEETSVAT